jgi:hypothetical protein
VGSRIQVPQRIYDIIQTLVCNYGGESLTKILINDVPLEIKQLVRYTGSGTLFYNSSTNVYTIDQEDTLSDSAYWQAFEYNQDAGYVYTDFIYPGTLISNIGDNVCTILEKIKNALGNFEYFYDINGNFHFQEIKNYLNNSYISNVREENPFLLDTKNKNGLSKNDLAIITSDNYAVDYYSNIKSVYTFTEGNGLITSAVNTPNYTNIKNDYHIWGEKDKYPIHYHVAIKNKPIFMNSYDVVYLKENGEYTGGLRLANEDDDINSEERDTNYVPLDWRAELYLQGLSAWKNQQRPDVYQQELLDLFDSIYDFRKKEFKADLVKNPNNLNYFFDYLEPIDNLNDCSVDLLNTKIYSYKQDKMNRLYNTDVPDVVIIDLSMEQTSRRKIIDRCELQGQKYTNVSSAVFKNLSLGTTGYTAQEVFRDLLYQYTSYNESINIQAIPIYYLDVNSRITVEDRQSGIHGDYIINSISLPLGAENNMSISATRALERI